MVRSSVRKALVILGYFVAVFLSSSMVMVAVTMLSIWDGASAGTAGMARVGIALAVSAAVFHSFAREKARPDDAPETQFG